MTRTNQVRVTSVRSSRIRVVSCESSVVLLVGTVPGDIRRRLVAFRPRVDHGNNHNDHQATSYDAYPYA